MASESQTSTTATGSAGGFLGLIEPLDSALVMKDFSSSVLGTIDYDVRELGSLSIGPIREWPTRKRPLFHSVGQA